MLVIIRGYYSVFFSCFFNLRAHAQREINNRSKGVQNQEGLPREWWEQQNWRVQLCLKAIEGVLLFVEGDLL